MGDFNENVTNKRFTTGLGQLGLVEVLSNKYGKPPNTYNRGTIPIDGIFASTSLQITQGGYTASDWGMQSDHRLLWIDICSNEMFGNLHPT